MPKFKEKRERFEVYPKDEIINKIKSIHISDDKTEKISEENMPEQETSAAVSAPSFTFSVNDIIKDAQRIREFRGDGDYALTSFFREVDTILPLLDNYPQVKMYVFQRIIINKIQGPALDAIRTLGSDATWTNIKSTLVNNFGVKETYHQLYQKALSTRNFQVREYYLALRNILSKLNEKYEYDPNKPTEFNPKINESIILNTFVNNIDLNLASVILNKNIDNLREAFNTLDSLVLVRDNHKIKNFTNLDQNKFKPNHNKNKNPHQNNNFDRHNKSDNNNFRQNQNNFKQNSGQYRQNYNTFRQNSGQFRHNYNSNTPRQVTQKEPEPMDIDHIQHEANFQLMPQKYTYQ